MTTRTCVIGVDPGPTPGIVALHWRSDDWSAMPPSLLRADVVQCSHLVAPKLVVALADREAGTVELAVEKFVVSSRAGRSSTPVAGYTTRALITELVNIAEVEKWSFARRPAAEVKPWASEERLEAAGLLEATKGMRHARDAARHALFASVRDRGIPDPLSKKSQQD